MKSTSLTLRYQLKFQMLVTSQEIFIVGIVANSTILKQKNSTDNVVSVLKLSVFCTVEVEQSVKMFL